jgi:hypothetical protein
MESIEYQSHVPHERSRGNVAWSCAAIGGAVIDLALAMFVARNTGVEMTYGTVFHGFGGYARAMVRLSSLVTSWRWWC